MRRWLLLLAALVWCGGALAQALDILTLKHRTAEQVLPQLRPLLESGASLSGTGNKIFLRASERNRAEIRQVLDALDQAPRRLMISVRHGDEQTAQARGAELSGDVALGPNARVVVPGSVSGSGIELRQGDSSVRTRVYETRRSGSENIAQQVQTLEGSRTFINVGQSMPLPLQQMVVTPAGVVVSRTVVYRDIGTGFYAEPHLAGDTVTLDISPTHDTPGALPGSANIERLSTTVSGRLGEWIALGGTVQDTSDDKAGTLRYGTRNTRETHRIWLKVEELR